MPIGVSILEADNQLRANLVREVRGQETLRLESVSGSLESALASLEKHPASVLLVGVSFPHAVALDWVASCRERFPRTRMLVLLDGEDMDLIVKAVYAGAIGFLCRTVSAAALAEAVRQVTLDGSPMSPQVARQLVARLQREAAPPESALDKLSDRERQVLELLAEGLSCKAIAQNLQISPSTVNAHAHAVYTKLGVRTRTQAVVMLLKCRADDILFSLTQPSPADAQPLGSTTASPASAALCR